MFLVQLLDICTFPEWLNLRELEREGEEREGRREGENECVLVWFASITNIAIPLAVGVNFVIYFDFTWQ